jgi:hypothetical protein
MPGNVRKIYMGCECRNTCCCNNNWDCKKDSEPKKEYDCVKFKKTCTCECTRCEPKKEPEKKPEPCCFICVPCCWIPCCGFPFMQAPMKEPEKEPEKKPEPPCDCGCGGQGDGGWGDR